MSCPARLKHAFAKIKLVIAAACVGLAATVAPAQGDDVFYNPRTTYGEVGLLDMPSARMDPDGELALTISAMNFTQRYNASFQLLPWLDASFRYSHVLYNPVTRPHDPLLDNLYDRSFGLKIRLMQESRYAPDLSLGFRDVLGTGVYAGEYLVASKQIDDFDITLGVGWGRFGESNAFPNPLTLISSSFKTRTAVNSITGTVNFGEFFHGPGLGVFGGAIWHTPIDNLYMILEYSSDRYDFEKTHNVVRERIPINVGLSYKFFDSITLSAGWLYGTSFGAALTFSANPISAMTPVRLGAEVPAPVVRTPPEQVRALSALLAPRPPARRTAVRERPWISVPETGDATQRDLVRALFSEGGGVRHAEKIGRTLLIEASLSDAPSGQCGRYARIAASFNVALDSVAVSDLGDARGDVVLCAVAHNADYVTASENGAPLISDGPAASNISPIEQKIRSDLAKQSLRTEALSIEDAELWLYFSNSSYNSESEAAGRVARLLMADAPTNIEIFHLVDVKHGQPMQDFVVTRAGLERAATVNNPAPSLGDAFTLQAPPLNIPALERAQNDTYPRLHWSIGPGFRQGLFDPDRALQVELFASADGEIELTPHLAVSGRIEASVFNNYSTSRKSNSELPHVRSDIVEYLDKGRNGLADLMVTYRDRPARDIYFEAKAGYLENMFAGAGAEVLWRPEDSRIAIGADAYEVWQRNFDRLFGFRDYHVFTGHVSVYYASPWYGLNFNIHAGRYLAGDYGATFELTRRFDTGVEIGAFATFTNVPFSKFGEGSFDKGIVIHIPFEWALPIFSQGSYDLLLRSLVRDGGQRLDNDDSLYRETLSTSYGEIVRHADEINEP